jgi:methionine-rich copper-binding protein CopC
MRKHFLLMFLLALLPLAGWAHNASWATGGPIKEFTWTGSPVSITGSLFTVTNAYNNGSCSLNTQSTSAPTGNVNQYNYSIHTSETAANNGTGAIASAVDQGSYWVRLSVRGRTGWSSYNSDVHVLQFKIKKPATLVGEPTLIGGLVYDNTEHALIDASGVSFPADYETTAGGVKYTVTDTDVAPASSVAGQDAIPTKIHAGTYYVWYKALADGDLYTDGAWTKVGTTGVKISRREIKLSDLTFEGKTNLTYTGSGQALVNAATWHGLTCGTFRYRVSGDSWSNSVPTRTDAGTYTVQLEITPNDDHLVNGGTSAAHFADADVSVQIAQATTAFTLEPTDLNPVYNGSPRQLISAAYTNFGTIQYRVGTSGSWYGNTQISSVTGTNAGEYTVNYQVVGNSNYTGLTGSITAHIQEADPGFNATSGELATGLVYNADNQKLIKTAYTAAHGTVFYYIGEVSKGTNINDVTGKNAGDYEIYYSVTGNTNYKDVAKTLLGTVNIAKKGLTIGADGKTVDWTGTALPLIDLVKVGKTGEIPAKETMTQAELLAQMVTLKQVENTTTHEITTAIPTDAGNYEYTLEAKAADPAFNYTIDNFVPAGELIINKVAAVITSAPQKVTKVYNKADQDLVDASSAKIEGDYGTFEYSLTPDVNSSWSADIPQGKDAKEYPVYYRVKGDKNHNDIDQATFTSEITPKPLEATDFLLNPTDDTYTGSDLKPAIETELLEADYDVVADDEMINVGFYDFVFTGKGNYKDSQTLTFEIKPAAATATAPEAAVGLVYTGAELALVSAAADVVGGEVQYSLDGGTTWSTDVPVGINADTYEVVWQLKADPNHIDIAPSAPISVTIYPKELEDGFITLEPASGDYTGSDYMGEVAVKTLATEPIAETDFTVATPAEMIDAGDYTFTFTGQNNYTGTIDVTFTIGTVDQVTEAATAMSLIYNGEDQVLVKDATTDGGYVEYALAAYDKENVLGEYGEWTKAAPSKAKNAGKYNVKWRFIEDDNHNFAEGGNVDVTILPVDMAIMLGNIEKPWDGEELTEEQVKKAYSRLSGEFQGNDKFVAPFTLELPEALENYVDADTYTFKQMNTKWTVEGEENYNLTFTGTGNITITKVDILDTDFTAPEAAADLTFNGEDQDLIAEGYEVTSKNKEDYPNTELAGKPYGTIMFATAEDGEYSEDVPQGNAADDYEVWYKIVGDKNHNDTDPVKIENTIAPKAIEFALAFEDDTWTYDGVEFWPEDVVAYDGEVKEENQLTDADYEMAVTKDGEEFEGTAIVDAGEYVFAYTGKGNYEGSTAEVTLTITPAELTKDMISEFTASKPYNKENQKPELTLTYAPEGKPALTLEEEVDYTVVAADEMIDAGEYTFTFTAVEGGNYAGEIEATFTITPLEVFAVAADAEKVYDGVAGLGDTEVEITYTGIKANEPEDAIVAGEGAVTVKNESAKVGTYEIVLVPEKFESKNYTVVVTDETPKAQFTITAAPLKVEWNGGKSAFTKVYGAEDPALTATAENLKLTGAVAADEAKIVEQTQITRAEGEAVGLYAVELSAKTGASVFDNYEVEFAGADEVFEITPATIKVAIAAQEKTYDGKAAVIEEVTADMLIVSGLQNGDDKAKIFTDMPTAKVADGEAVNAGEYEVALSGGESADYEVEFLPSTFTIKPATITGTLSAQKVQQGQPLDETAFTLTGIAEGDEDFFYVTAPGLVDMDGIVTGDAGVYAKGLTVGIADDVIDNYTAYDKITGELEIISAEAIVMSDTEAFKTEAKAGATVTFSSRSINQDKWNVCALPFATTPGEISDAFGYAIVDVLNETNAIDNEMHFKVITSGTIPAYTPFLFKPTSEEADHAKANFDEVVFKNVDVEAGGDKNYDVADAAGNKFWGTFKETTTFYGAKYWYMSKGVWKDAANYTEAKPVSLKPFRAYCEIVNPAGARIVIEEEDGTLTTIDAANFNNEVMTAEGWYTVDGKKLNAAPTQKGVYIQNGKKVVIK